MNVAKGTPTVGRAKTAAGVRVVDLTPALRDELAVWLDRSAFSRPTDLVFPTQRGRKDTRQNVRRRLLLPAVARANERLAELAIEPIGGSVGLHSLRRTFASLRVVAGDDISYISEQIGHVYPTFTMRVYPDAVKRRQRLAGAELAEFERALQWALMGTNAHISEAEVAPVVSETRRNPASQVVSL